MTRIHDLEVLDDQLREEQRSGIPKAEFDYIANQRESIRQQLRILRQSEPIALPPMEWDVVPFYKVVLLVALIMIGVHLWLR